MGLGMAAPHVAQPGDTAKRKQMWQLLGVGCGNLWGLAYELTHFGSHHPVCSLQTQNVQLNKEMTLASNRSLAEGNLLYQPQLDALKARLTQKYQELQVLFEAYQIKKTKLGNFFRVIFQE